jgi:hypothetical protein
MPIPFKTMLRRQYRITAFIEKKIQIVNYIKAGYDNDMPILINSKFLHFTAHIYYRSIIVDLGALFGKPNKNNKYSFYYIDLNYKDNLKDKATDQVESWLAEHIDHIEVIKTLRDESIAHYDFNQTDTISLKYDDLEKLNDLYNLAKKTISYLGTATKDESESIQFDLERDYDEVKSLKRLISKAASQ